MSATLRLVAAGAGRGVAGRFGLDLARYDRRLSLTGAETAALAVVGIGGLRRSRARGAVRHEVWSALTCLTRPLDAAHGHRSAIGYFLIDLISRKWAGERLSIERRSG